MEPEEGPIGAQDLSEELPSYSRVVDVMHIHRPTLSRKGVADLNAATLTPSMLLAATLTPSMLLSLVSGTGCRVSALTRRARS